MIRRLFFVTTVLLIAVFGLLAADVSGKWVAEQPGRNGGPARQITFTFKASGDALTGTISQAGRNGNMDSAISEGKVDGNNISFKISREMGGDTITIQYTGTVNGDTINLKMNMEGPDGPITRDLTAKKSTT